MYRNCLFCHATLGRNETVEAFQTGRQLAFDQQKGRLWVICPACCRWNLAPIEERWEAIEQCEREFRGTVLRKSTDNIGLAHARDGTQLVRVGKPLVPELAAWRYQTRLVRRYQVHKKLLQAGAIVNIAGQGLRIAYLATASTAATMASAVLGVGLFGIMGAHVVLWRKGGGGRRMFVKLPDREQPVRVRPADARVLRVLPDDHSGWKIRLPHTTGVAELTGPTAVFAVGLVLPRVTWTVASPDVMDRAVQRIVEQGGPERVLAAIANENRGRYGTIREPDAMIAAEISANLTAESEYLTEHLQLLEGQWREAEEIANIADSLAVPEEVASRLEELQQERSSAVRESGPTAASS